MRIDNKHAWISRVRLVLTFLLCAVVLLTAVDAFACPTCKDGLAENDPASQAHARGFFYSILFMMAMPFLILGTFGGAAYYSIRRAREQQLASKSHERQEPQAVTSGADAVLSR